MISRIKKEDAKIVAQDACISVDFFAVASVVSYTIPGIRSYVASHSRAIIV